MSAPYTIRHRKTGMYVARQVAPKSANFRMPCANWKWVWKFEDAEKFQDKMLLIHPIIQIGCDGNVICSDAAGNEVEA